MLKKVLVSALVAATMAASAMAQSGEPATIPMDSKKPTITIPGTEFELGRADAD